MLNNTHRYVFTAGIVNTYPNIDPQNNISINKIDINNQFKPFILFNKFFILLKIPMPIYIF